MLTIAHKAPILAKVGINVPVFPARRLPVEDRHLLNGARAPQEELDADAQQVTSIKAWNKTVEGLYVEYVAARAARSLREAEEAQQLYRLQLTNSGMAANDGAVDIDRSCAASHPKGTRQGVASRIGW